MKINEIKELPDQELQKRISEEEENLAHLRFQKATSQLESPIKIRTVRRMIARMRTIMREREQGKSAVVAAKPAPAVQPETKPPVKS